MNLEVAIRNRWAVCALMLMLAPFGISVPTFLNAARAKPHADVVTLAELHPYAYVPSIQMGGTIVYGQPTIVDWDPLP